MPRSDRCVPGKTAAPPMTAPAKGFDPMHSRPGFVIILSAPSGAGKTTLARALVERLPGVRISVSTTTRAPRPGEQDGVDYCFSTREVFQNLTANNGFLEWAEVFGNFYGTSRALVEACLEQGEDVLLAIDWQGARQVRQRLPGERVVSIFVAPPSPQALWQRLEARGQDDQAVIQRRMEQAREEFSHWSESDYLVINDDLEQAKADLIAIIRAERLRRVRPGPAMASAIAAFSMEETALGACVPESVLTNDL